MEFIADFHIHSHFSMATSKSLNPEQLDGWAQLKGIKVMGTGDFVHPGWFAELEKRFEPAEEGLFKLKDEYKLNDEDLHIPESCKGDVRFILTAELSSIYKKKGKVRKVHNLIFAPSFKAAGYIQGKLDKLGNIRSDGRPILGLDSRDILEIVLESSPDSFLVPAHIWTPWFSVLGSRSGFDAVDECYDDLADHVFAVETGLSSDPEMNWMCSSLDKYTLISNSDAHSPSKIGREANIFDTELSYKHIKKGLEKGKKGGFKGTIEFFPQEGKYHYDGHRKCDVVFNPLETLEHDSICPVCKKKLTVGVMYRVAELADRNPEDYKDKTPFYSITSLASLLSEVKGVGENTKTVKKAYHALLEKEGPEFSILLNRPIESIAASGEEAAAEGIRRMRKGEAIVESGYDGEFGNINFFQDTDDTNEPIKSVEFSVPEFKKLLAEKKEKDSKPGAGEQLTFF